MYSFRISTNFLGPIYSGYLRILDVDALVLFTLKEIFNLRGKGFAILRIETSVEGVQFVGGSEYFYLSWKELNFKELTPIESYLTDELETVREEAKKRIKNV